jgi:hypothetical protein
VHVCDAAAFEVVDRMLLEQSAERLQSLHDVCRNGCDLCCCYIYETSQACCVGMSATHAGFLVIERMLLHNLHEVKGCVLSGCHPRHKLLRHKL